MENTCSFEKISLYGDLIHGKLFSQGKEVRSRSDRDRDVKLSWAHTVTLKHTDINFWITDSVAMHYPDVKKTSNYSLAGGK